MIVSASSCRNVARSASSSASPSGGNSGTPEGSRKHLNPNTPRSCRPRSSVRLPGIAPPQKPTSTWQRPTAADRFDASASGLTVGGRLLSGMSMMVVIPPAAAAAVAVGNPSQSARPGSLTWTWVSTRPGISTSSSVSSIIWAPRLAASNGSTAAILPPRTATQRAGAPQHHAERQSPGLELHDRQLEFRGFACEQRAELRHRDLVQLAEYRLPCRADRVKARELVPDRIEPVPRRGAWLTDQRRARDMPVRGAAAHPVTAEEHQRHSRLLPG